MFLKKLKSEWNSIRMSTVVAAYEDCAGFVELQYFIKLMGMPANEAIQYIYKDILAEEIIKLSEPGQEVDQPDSYFVYFRALGITGKSPYSVSEVPHLHNFIHAVGAVLSRSRSLDAYTMEDEGIDEMIKIGVNVGFLIWNTADVRRTAGLSMEEAKQMEDEEEDEEGADQQSEDGDERNRFPTTRDPNRLLQYIKDNPGWNQEATLLITSKLAGMR